MCLFRPRLLDMLHEISWEAWVPLLFDSPSIHNQAGSKHRHPISILFPPPLRERADSPQERSKMKKKIIESVACLFFSLLAWFDSMDGWGRGGRGEGKALES